MLCGTFVILLISTINTEGLGSIDGPKQFLYYVVQFIRV